MTHTSTRSSTNEASLGELAAQVAEQSARLARQEAEHAKAELREDVRHAGIGAGLAGAASLLGLFGAATLVVAAVAALDLALDLWLAAIIVAAALLVLAGATALMAKRQAVQAGPPIQTVDSVKTDVATLKRADR